MPIIIDALRPKQMTHLSKRIAQFSILHNDFQEGTEGTLMKPMHDIKLGKRNNIPDVRV